MLVKKVVSKPITMLIIFVLIIMLSLYTFSKLKVNLFPDIGSTSMFILTSYPGAAPKEVEEKITKLLEGSLNSLSGLKNIKSTSGKESSSVVLEFYDGTNLDLASNDIRDALELVKSLLPKEAGTPRVIKFNTANIPIMSIVMYGYRSLSDLKTYAKDTIKPKLEQVNGVAFVIVSGGSEKYVSVEISQNKLESYGLTLTEIVPMIQSQNFELSAGDIIDNNVKYLVQASGRFRTIEDIGNVVIAYKTPNIYSSMDPSIKEIKLRDIAEIRETYKDVDSYNEYNGKPNISIQIQKQSGANAVEVANGVRQKLEEIKTTIPKDINIEITQDDTDFIRSAIKTVSSSAYGGAFLAIFIILFFLRSFRATLIIGIAIPVAVIVTFLLMYFANVSINLMSLSGLALGVGMLVDCSIVVIDNIYKYRQKGTKLESSAILGSQEMMMPIIASTLTTICVFAPMLLFRAELGMIGEFFRDFSFTIVISLTASLLVAIFLVPVLASHYVKLYTTFQRPISNKHLKNIDSLFANLYFSLEVSYVKLLNWVLHHKMIFCLIVLLSLIGSLCLFPFLNVSVMPSFEQNTYRLSMSLPTGSTIEQTKFYIDKIREIAMKEIKGYKGISSSAGVSSLYGLGGVDSTEGSIDVVFPLKEEAIEGSDTPLTAEQKIKKHFDLFPGVKFTSSGNQSATNSTPINIKISSNDFDKASDYGKLLASTLKKEIPELLEVNISVSESLPQIDIEIDRERAYAYGINMSTISNELKANINGITASQYTENGINYDIVLRLKRSDVKNLKDLEKIFVTNKESIKIPISSIAKLNKTKSVVSISRENQASSIRLTAKIAPNSNLGNVNTKVKNFVLTKMPQRDGVLVSFEGEYEDFVKYMTQFAIIIFMAIILVFGIMASQFESLLKPFIILFTIPLTIVGVVLVYFISREQVSTFTAVGMLMLVGVVVNTGIVLIDYTHLLIKRGFGLREAILEAGRSRLRPILMSALTSIIGLVPMAFASGSGNELLKPIAVTFIGGMVASTFLTLLFIPLVFEFLSKKRTKPFILFRPFIYIYNLIFRSNSINLEKNKSNLKLTSSETHENTHGSSKNEFKKIIEEDKED